MVFLFEGEGRGDVEADDKEGMLEQGNTRE